MRKTICPWEEKNLGCKTIEICIDENDTFLEDDFMTSPRLASYIVVKVPTNKPDYLWRLQQLGYTFVEAQFQVSKKIKEFNFKNRFIESIFPKLSFCTISDTERLEEMIELITPDMFKTDRIYIDAYFDKKASCTRYSNWLRNEFGKKDINIVSMNYNNAAIGFFMERYDGKTSDNLLAGIFEKYQDYGLGILTPSGPILKHYLKNESLIKLTTSISSNNSPVFNLYQYLDFQIDKTFYVFVKHQ